MDEVCAPSIRRGRSAEINGGLRVGSGGQLVEGRGRWQQTATTVLHPTRIQEGHRCASHLLVQGHARR